MNLTSVITRVEHKLHSSENKKVIGKFKDELNGVVLMTQVLWNKK